MSNSNTPRIAETTVYSYETDTRKEQRYETGYRFSKREYGGWHINLTDHSATRTIHTDSLSTPVDEFDGRIGWVTPDRDNGGWTLWHCHSGEFQAVHLGTGWSTRDEAAEELIRELLTRHHISPAKSDEYRFLATDYIDFNELTLTASKPVDQFKWEREYNEYLARKAEQQGASK